MILLWLDDYRNPFLDVEGKVLYALEYLPCSSIHWVRNYDEFVAWIEKYGLPASISFDHDLADEHYTPQEHWYSDEKVREWMEAQEWVEKTGYDCAKYLVEYCMDNKKILPFYSCHSANPVGKKNILSLLNNYVKHAN